MKTIVDMVFAKDGRDGKIDTKNDKIWFDIDKIRFNMKMKNLEKYRYKTDIDIILIFKFELNWY